MGSSPNLPEPAETAELVAYLDGELPNSQAQVIAQRAAHDEGTRREVNALRETWGMLDHLPRARADDAFSTRTLNALRVHDDEDEAASHESSNIPTSAARPWRLAALTALVLLSTGLGVGLVRLAWPSRDTRLIQQLSLAEHLDDYRAVGSIEFLRWLDESDTFDDAD